MKMRNKIVSVKLTTYPGSVGIVLIQHDTLLLNVGESVLNDATTATEV